MPKDKFLLAHKQDKNFWKTATFVAFTNKYNDRIISYMGPWTGSWNIPVCNLSHGDELAQDNRLVEFNKTQPFFNDFMARICLCLNYCKNMTNEELRGASK